MYAVVMLENLFSIPLGHSREWPSGMEHGFSGRDGPAGRGRAGCGPAGRRRVGDLVPLAADPRRDGPVGRGRAGM